MCSGINIHQTDAASLNEYNGRGFSSGAKKPSGTFRETFVAPGTYYYSSDSVWNVNLFMPWRVVVEADDTDSDLEVAVMMTDIPAFHDLTTGKSENSLARDDRTDVQDLLAVPSPPSQAAPLLILWTALLLPSTRTSSSSSPPPV